MCATTNTYQVKSYEDVWDILHAGVEHAHKRTNFTTKDLTWDDSLTLGQNYSRILFQKLIKVGMRELGQRTALFPNMSHHNVETLWFFLMDRFFDLQRESFSACGVTEYGCSVPEMFFQCRRAAETAVENFDADTYRLRQEKATRGGLAYSTYTLEDFLETRGMSAREAAAHLGIKVRNVYNMRKKYEHIDSNTGEIHV
ncbi:helix-turn-helix domain-containing protein [Microbacterium sp. NPDC097977]|uniref:helix-turn-helix domain-containing protein n=1 Tax=Microbacterium sp. NPDC097977 TaxID=3155686 RepID=UPI00332488EB